MLPPKHKAVEQYEKTGDKKYLSSAFFISEKSKGTLLLDAVRQTSAHAFTGIPESIVTKQDRLQTQITRIEKTLLRANDLDKRQQLTDSLAKVKTDYFSFVRTFEDAYPAYYNLKYNNSVSEITSVQKSLKKGEAVLQYYVDGNTVYALFIKKDGFEFKKLVVNDLEEQIAIYHRLLSNYGPESASFISEKSKLLKQDILPFETNKIHHLTIVPDGPLYYVPFETLQDEDGRFLLETTAISFAPSMTFLQESKSGVKRKGKGLLALAPSFDGKVLAKLPFNRQEVESLSEQFKNKQLYFDDDAIKEAFQQNAEKARIIHLATHAIVNDEQPDFTYLAFSDSNGVAGEPLYLADIYNTKLQADLVTLSACETAIGDLMLLLWHHHQNKVVCF